MHNDQSKIFVILIGVSGVGKSTIINEITSKSNDFEYVKPYMTRAARPGEKSKISISDQEFEAMRARNEFVVVNEHYGAKYGTPKTTILNIINQNKIPILDYQLSKISNLTSSEYNLLRIYVRPESIEDWEQRIKSSVQFDESRFELGKAELENVLSKDKIENIDYIVKNEDGQLQKTINDVFAIVSKFIH